MKSGSLKPYKLTLGRRGEQLAAEFLEAKGFRIIERNLRFGHDELDIVARDGDCLVFVEVKSRAHTAANIRYGRPAAAVNREKQARMKRAIQAYLRERTGDNRDSGKSGEVELDRSSESAPGAESVRAKARLRIDVVEVYFPAIHADTPIELSTLRAERIVHMQNVVYK